MKESLNLHKLKHPASTGNDASEVTDNFRNEIRKLNESDVEPAAPRNISPEPPTGPLFDSGMVCDEAETEVEGPQRKAEVSLTGEETQEVEDRHWQREGMVCRLCGKKFFLMMALRQHMKYIHAESSAIANDSPTFAKEAVEPTSAQTDEAMEVGVTTRGQCYINFYRRKLQICLLSLSVCSWQAFSASSSV